MRKAVQGRQAQNLPVVRQAKGGAVEPSEGKRLAEFGILAESGPQARRMAQLATMADASQSIAAQRRLSGMIDDSPRMAAQRKATEKRKAEPDTLQSVQAPAKPNDTGLPDRLKSGIESLSGISMDNVRVHYNSSRPAQLNALAYAQGADIHVAPGQEKHLPHEAWHVVQQAQGRVKPTMQMKEGVPVNDDQGLEREADVMGERALAVKIDDSRKGPVDAVQGARQTEMVQRVEKRAPSGNAMIDVVELEDYLPNCVDNGELSRKGYRRSDGITEGWNDTDLFYADGEGPLVQITVQMVNDYWDPKYEGFTRVGRPDWTKNCEDYAKGYAGAGVEKGDYDSTETLASLIQETGCYVLKMGSHWMSVQKSDESHITIRQKDGESAVYQKDFALADGLAYILDKYSAGGKVFKAT